MTINSTAAPIRSHVSPIAYRGPYRLRFDYCLLENLPDVVAEIEMFDRYLRDAPDGRKLQLDNPRDEPLDAYTLWVMAMFYNAGIRAIDCNIPTALLEAFSRQAVVSRILTHMTLEQWRDEWVRWERDSEGFTFIRLVGSLDAQPKTPPSVNLCTLDVSHLPPLDTEYDPYMARWLLYPVKNTPHPNDRIQAAKSQLRDFIDRFDTVDTEVVFAFRRKDRFYVAYRKRSWINHA